LGIEDIPKCLDDGLVPAVGVIFRFHVARAVVACHDLGPSYRDSSTDEGQTDLHRIQVNIIVAPVERQQ
jgi:hypothetical protein